MELSDRERQIITLLLDGCSNQEIADELNMAERTVKKYLNLMFIRFGIDSGIKRVKLACLFYRHQKVRGDMVSPMSPASPSLSISQNVN